MVETGHCRKACLPGQRAPRPARPWAIGYKRQIFCQMRRGQPPCRPSRVFVSSTYWTRPNYDWWNFMVDRLSLTEQRIQRIAKIWVLHTFGNHGTACFLTLRYVALLNPLWLFHDVDPDRRPKLMGWT
jgi:hypothetical protein